jgi:hypothetical protein
MVTLDIQIIYNSCRMVNSVIWTYNTFVINIGTKKTPRLGFQFIEKLNHFFYKQLYFLHYFGTASALNDNLILN